MAEKPVMNLAEVIANPGAAMALANKLKTSVRVLGDNGELVFIAHYHHTGYTPCVPCEWCGSIDACYCPKDRGPDTLSGDHHPSDPVPWLATSTIGDRTTVERAIVLAERKDGKTYLSDVLCEALPTQGRYGEPPGSSLQNAAMIARALNDAARPRTTEPMVSLADAARAVVAHHFHSGLRGEEGVRRINALSAAIAACPDYPLPDRALSNAERWPTGSEGDTHTRLTYLVDENLGSRPTMPIEKLLDALEAELPKLKAEAEAADRLRLMFLECWACNGALAEPTIAPHCSDCVLDPDARELWEEWLRSTRPKAPRPETAVVQPPASFFDRLRVLWGEAHDLKYVTTLKAFTTWSGATKDLLIDMGLERDNEKDDYVQVHQKTVVPVVFDEVSEDGMRTIIDCSPKVVSEAMENANLRLRYEIIVNSVKEALQDRGAPLGHTGIRNYLLEVLRHIGETSEPSHTGVVISRGQVHEFCFAYANNDLDKMHPCVLFKDHKPARHRDMSGKEWGWPIPTRHRHYKGGLYDLLFLAHLSEEREKLVAVYKSLEKDTIWVRPYADPHQDSWTDVVTMPDGTKRLRFKPLPENAVANRKGRAGETGPQLVDDELVWIPAVEKK